jgi:hypothetical protein
VIDRFFQRRDAAVVHVWRGQRDVAQRRRAKGADIARVVADDETSERRSFGIDENFRTDARWPEVRLRHGCRKVRQSRRLRSFTDARMVDALSSVLLRPS